MLNPEKTSLPEAVEHICEVGNQFMDEVRAKIAFYSREFHLPKLQFIAMLEGLKMELFNIYYKEAVEPEDDEE